VKHKRALVTIGTAAVLDIAGGLVFAGIEHLPSTTGLYWAVTTATTVGYGDVTPTHPLGRVVAVMVMLTVIPLFAATFSLITSGITTDHVSRETDRLHRHLEHMSTHLDIPAMEAEKEAT
jgi:voltage-gated potassium channel